VEHHLVATRNWSSSTRMEKSHSSMSKHLIWMNTLVSKS
jgi:hypothetical protein